MTDSNFFRIGGVAAALGVLILMLGSFLHTLLWIGAVLLAVFYFIVYRSLGAQRSALNLAAVTCGIGGAVLMIVNMLALNTVAGLLYNLAVLVIFYLAPWFISIQVLHNRNLGLPRALAIIGIVAAVFGFLNFLIINIGGGDYTNPNNAALMPLIMGTYLVGMLAALVWLIWSGIVLFRKA
jgi:hypothetical protein